MGTPMLVSIRKNRVDRTKQWLTSVAYALAWIIMVGCQSSQPERIVHLVPVHSLQVPEGEYYALAWLPNDRVILNYQPKGKQGPESNLWIMRSDGSEFHELALPSDIQNECSWTEYHDPITLSDGQAAYVRSCHMEKEPFRSSSILVLNPGTQTSQPLFTQQIPESALFSIAFGSDLSHGVGATYSDIEHYMFGIDNQGTYTLELGLLRPNRPAWSPDGKHLAFFGNRAMGGDAGPIWATQAYDLWLMPADCISRSRSCSATAQLLTQGVNGPTRVAWSPNGNWLVFDGDVQGQGKGIWLLDARRQKLYQIAVGNYERPTWSPDGQSIMVVVGSPVQSQSDPTLISYTSLAILDVNELVKDSGISP